MPDYDFKNYNRNLRDYARDLRNNPPPQERKLWYAFLKDYTVRLNRQRIIDNYIADFYSHKARLAIELDGSQHYTEEGMDYDAARIEEFQKYDIMVLRFTNREIDQYFEGVCSEIDRVVKERLKSQP